MLNKLTSSWYIKRILKSKTPVEYATTYLNWYSFLMHRISYNLESSAANIRDYVEKTYRRAYNLKC